MAIVPCLPAVLDMDSPSQESRDMPTSSDKCDENIHQKGEISSDEDSVDDGDGKDSVQHDVASPNVVKIDSPPSASGPNQPIIMEYHPKKCGKETFQRDFQSEWFKIYPWLSYDNATNCGTCFACREFMHTDHFLFENWKKPERLKKHTKSKTHLDAMTKWMQYRAAKKQNMTILTQLDKAHEQKVAQNRAYIKVIVECLIFTAQQNIAQRGKHEDRSRIHEVSDINRGNFLELLHMRCKDIPWLSEKLQTQLGEHAQWTSPDICNEILEIVANLVLQLIRSESRTTGLQSLIMDETSDISHIEQVAMCIRYIFEGKTKESFIGFYPTKSTDGESLYKLVLEVFGKLDLQLDTIVGECFDGASNMSGVNRGLATRMKECSPLGIYVHCYGHLLNLAIQDTLTPGPLRNALGTTQSLYNFLEGSPKRHAVFSDIEVDKEHMIHSLKSQSVTRWSCRWQAVKAVLSQMTRIIKALLTLSEDRDPKTYSDSRALLNAVCDFEFVFGLYVFKLILSNTSSLSQYLQGKSVDVISAKRSADATKQTLKDCRNDEMFELVWKQAELLGNNIKECIADTDYEFKEPKLPRARRPPRRLEGLMGTTGAGEAQQYTTPRDYYLIDTYFCSIDKVVSEMESRFDVDDQSVLCALGDVVLNEATTASSYDKVAGYYDLDRDILEAEKKSFINCRKQIKQTIPLDSGHSAANVVEYMYAYDQHDILCTFYKCACILATIPATSCSAERAFSGLRRLKTYLRNTMGQERLNNLAILNIERVFTNKIMEGQMEDIINIFGGRRGRNCYFH
ncbi:zinc finger MYM-type protein 1-like [Apostichopus japonicus]|uniref:zinc finger MYM-type protein 1-like n=1 Tax=Stichopus japonicus TaxID=307972 RepID=UPI003AB6EAF2